MLNLELLRASCEMMIQFQHLKQLELSHVSIIMVSGIMITLVIAINLTVSEAFLSLPSFNKDSSGIMITLVIAINLTVSEAFLSLPSFNKDSSSSYFVPEAVQGIQDKGINGGSFHGKWYMQSTVRVWRRVCLPLLTGFPISFVEQFQLS